MRDSIFVGTTDDGYKIALPDEIRSGHVQVIGATGRGKTRSVILPWTARDMVRGKSAILVCGKGDTELRTSLEEVERMIVGRELPKVLTFDLGNPDLSCVMNPLKHGSAQQITDRLFTTFTFEEPYYKARQLEVASNIVSLIQEGYTPGGGSPRPGTVTFRRLYELLTDDNELRRAVIATTSEKIRSALTRHLSLPRSEREGILSGLISQIAPFAVGEVADLVNGGGRAGPEQTEVSISETVVPELAPGHRGPQVLLFLVPTLKYQDLGRQLGKLLMQELGWAVGERASRGGRGFDFLPVMLDEFSSFVYPGFENILNKARSSRVALHLSHQAQGDLQRVSPEFANIVTTNTNVKCVMGVNDPDSADFLARHMGTRRETKRTERARKPRGLFSAFSNDEDDFEDTGDMSLREVEAYKIHPNELKELGQGEGVLHFPVPGGGTFTERLYFGPVDDEDFKSPKGKWREIWESA